MEQGGSLLLSLQLQMHMFIQHWATLWNRDLAGWSIWAALRYGQ